MTLYSELLVDEVESDIKLFEEHSRFKEFRRPQRTSSQLDRNVFMTSPIDTGRDGEARSFLQTNYRETSMGDLLRPGGLLRS